MESNPKPSTSKTEYLGVPNHASQLVINGSHQSIDRQKSETKSHITFSNESIGSNPGSIGSRTGSFNSESIGADGSYLSSINYDSIDAHDRPQVEAKKKKAFCK